MVFYMPMFEEKNCKTQDRECRLHVHVHMHIKLKGVSRKRHKHTFKVEIRRGNQDWGYGSDGKGA